MGERIRLVVTVKAYPSASVKYGEAVCVAGIRSDTERPEWVRLYPVEFRDLPIDQRFTKWSEIEVDVSASTDQRPESRKPNTSTITVLRTLGTANRWAERLPFVEPILVESMCETRRMQEANRVSLAAFRPFEVRDVVVEPEPDDWTPQQLSSLSQLSLFAQDKTVLEKIPWRWKYSYSCGRACNGHVQTIIDWEAAQAWRSWRRQHGPDRAAQMVREKWLNELASAAKDTVFFVGNQHQRPESFLVLGVFWPPKPASSEDMEHLDLGG